MEINLEHVPHYYVLLFDQDAPTNWFVKLTDKTGIWKDLIYSYGRIDAKDIKKVKYEWTISYAPDSLQEVDRESQELAKELSDLLGVILVNIIQTYGEKLTLDATTGKIILNFTQDDIK